MENVSQIINYIPLSNCRHAHIFKALKFLFPKREDMYNT